MTPIDLNTIILAITALITAVTPIMLAIINQRQVKSAAAQAAKVEAVRQDLKAQTAGVEDKLDTIHTAVNSERTAMIEELKRLHETIRSLTQDNARLEGTPPDERARIAGEGGPH